MAKDQEEGEDERKDKLGLGKKVQPPGRYKKIEKVAGASPCSVSIRGIERGLGLFQKPLIS